MPKLLDRIQDKLELQHSMPIRREPGQLPGLPMVMPYRDLLIVSMATCCEIVVTQDAQRIYAQARCLMNAGWRYGPLQQWTRWDAVAVWLAGFYAGRTADD